MHFDLTEKELSLLKDQLAAEEMLIAKYHQYAAQCEDPQLRTKCQQAAAQHRNHYNKLLDCLG